MMAYLVRSKGRIVLLFRYIDRVDAKFEDNLRTYLTPPFYPSMRHSQTTSSCNNHISAEFAQLNTSSPKPQQAEEMMKRLFASIDGSVRPMTLCWRTCASTEVHLRVAKIRIIIDLSRRIISEIKLKRTDTTLDLSQTMIYR